MMKKCVLVLLIAATTAGCQSGQDAKAAGPKVIVLGFDGLDYGLTKKLMDEGRMPNFSKVAKSGSFGPLETSVPPQSPVAWSDFMTGLDSGGHGIYDFLHRDADTMIPFSSTSQPGEAAQAGDIVVLAVPWPAMETVAQNLGSLDGKIVIDVSFPHEQGDDGYYQSILETSSAEMIQQWNPGARVLKTFALQASYVIDDPGVVGGPVSIPIASDDREAKEQVAEIIAAMGLDPIDAGPLRLSRELEAMQRLYGVPFFQRREAAWEFYFRRSYFWECIWEDDWSDPVADADELADVPETQGPAIPCPGTR